MPNWCFTDITFSGKEENLKKFATLIEDWISIEKNNANGFGNYWLGNIVVNSGLATYDDVLNMRTHKCRGEIIDINVQDDLIQIFTDTAWIPMMKLWKGVIDKHNLDLDIVYIAEEVGAELYQTNDPEYKNKYKFQLEYLDDDTWACSESEVLELCKKYCDIESNNIDDCMNKFKQYCDENDALGSIYKWEFVEINDEEMN